MTEEGPDLTELSDDELRALARRATNHHDLVLGFQIADEMNRRGWTGRRESQL